VNKKSTALATLYRPGSGTLSASALSESRGARLLGEKARHDHHHHHYHHHPHIIIILPLPPIPDGAWVRGREVPDKA
jgi:hypothetical protein